LLHYYKDLRTNNSLEESYWNTENINDGIETTEKLKEALKKKQEMENHLANIT
jgi:hypothetical protein